MIFPRNLSIYLKLFGSILLPVFLFLAPTKVQAPAIVVHKVSAALITTTDPFFTTDSLAEDRQWYLAKTSVPQAWDYTKGSSSIIVAIVDTGIHATQLELNDGRVGDGYNVLTNQ